jgi:hypothetical protein
MVKKVSFSLLIDTSVLVLVQHRHCTPPFAPFTTGQSQKHDSLADTNVTA